MYVFVFLDHLGPLDEYLGNKLYTVVLRPAKLKLLQLFFRVQNKFQDLDSVANPCMHGAGTQVN